MLISIAFNPSFTDVDFKNMDWLQISVDTPLPTSKYQLKDTINTHSIHGEGLIIEYGASQRFLFQQNNHT